MVPFLVMCYETSLIIEGREKENKKILGAIAALAMTVGLAARVEHLQARATNQNEVVVGMEAGYPPV